MGPLEHGERTTDQSEGWPARCGPVRRRHMDVPSADPGGRERILSTGANRKNATCQWHVAPVGGQSKEGLPRTWAAEQDAEPP